MITLPVIHLQSEEQVLRNADIAFQAGADGVFVICMDGADHVVPAAGKAIKERFPEKQVGINLLHCPAFQAIAMTRAFGLDMTWHDAPGIANGYVDASVYDLVPAGHTFFGSVAFKYQKADATLEWSALMAARYGMIPTTSGRATGKAPAVEKVKRMFDKLMAERVTPTLQLAVASGLTPENIHEFKPYITHALVCTGVSSSFYEFNPERLKAFVEAAT